MKTKKHLMTILLSFVVPLAAGASVGKKEQLHINFNNKIDEVASERKELAKSLTHLMDETKSNHPESRGVVDFIDTELGWERESVVDNRQPNSIKN